LTATRQWTLLTGVHCFLISEGKRQICDARSRRFASDISKPEERERLAARIEESFRQNQCGH
jgi:hypothetical protein